MNPLACIKRILPALFSFTSVTLAQSTATLTVLLVDPSGGAVTAARVSLTHRASNFQRDVLSSTTGHATIGNLPFQTYDVTIEKDGFQPLRQTVDLRSNVPVSLNLRLELLTSKSSLNVLDVEQGALVDPQETSTRTQMNQADIEKMPASIRGLESVLVSFPGFSQNANGAIHPRGAHNQMTYVVDGMPITDQLTGAFANSVDPAIVQTLELFTSSVPAEYGSKVSGVANITTRSGLGSGRRGGGSVTLGAAEYGMLSSTVHAAGERGRLGYSGSFQALKSNRYLDQVSQENLHNGGNLERGFGRLDWQPTDRDLFRFSTMTGRSSFELANLRSQHANVMDQRQKLTDFSGMMGWIHTIGSRTTFDSTASVRSAAAYLLPSDGDTPVTAWQSRRLTTFTFWNRMNRMQGSHTMKAGLDVQHFPVREEFRFGITDAAFNSPGSAGFIPTLLAHDLSRGGRQFEFRKRGTGSMYTGFAQDNFRWGRFQFQVGARYDVYRFLVQGNQLQPRLGLSFHIRETGTVLRASYNRNYQTPPNENLLLSSAQESAALVAENVRQTLGGAVAQIRPERQNVYEAGLQQALWGRLSLNVSYYHKNARDQQDNNNFFNTGIIFPMALSRIRVNGAEARLAIPEIRHFSGTLSVTHARAISTPPFSGGLFIGNSAVEILNVGPFFIDHDQKLSSHGVLRYARRGFYSTVSTRYDSGLVTNPSDPAVVASDADYADLLPYVNLTGRPPRTRPRVVTDMVAGYERRKERTGWDVSVQVSNLTNKMALYNFQSLFVGTRLVQPRTLGVKLKWSF